MNEHWIADFKNGRSTAFNHVFRSFYKPLCYFAASLVKTEPEAEDIVTEVMLKLWSLRGDFESESSIKGFLYISVKNACLDFLKRASRSVPHQKEYFYYEELRRLLEENNNYVSAQMAKAEVLQEISQEIDRLPEKCRAIFRMSFLEGLKNDDIAGILNLSAHTVKAQKARGLKILRTTLLKKRLLAVWNIFFAAF